MATKTSGGDPQDSDLKGEETVMHFFGADTGLCPEFIGGLVDPKVVNVIDAMIDPQKKDMKMLVQIASHRQHVNCIRGKRPRVEESSSESSITFTDADLEGVDQPHNDALVISLKIACQLVDKILVDPGSACNVMFMNLFETLMLKPEDLKQTSTLMYGFDGTEVQPLGVVLLPICVEPVIEPTQFLVVDLKSASYNAIIGRPFLHKTKAVASTFHQLVKFHPIMGIEAIRGDQKVSKECCMIEVKAKEKAVKTVATSGIADGCMRSDSGPIVGDDFAELAEEELDYYLVLVGAVSNPKKPFAAIVGGSEVSSKIGVIESLLEKVDMPLLGGGKILTSYKAQGYSVGSSLVEEDTLDLATSLLEKAKFKGVVLMLPTDVVVADKVAADANSKIVLASGIPGDCVGFDIGPDSIKTFGEAVVSTNTIIWNGPTGVFVFDKFAVGTEGCPKGVTPKYSLKLLVPRQSELLGIKVKMVNDCIGEEVQIMVAEIPGGVLLLENVRFYKEEEKNDPEFAKKLASLEFLYTNDAFGTAHRAHAYTEGVAKYLKLSVAGFLMQKTIAKKLAELSSGKGGGDSVVVVEKVGLVDK